MDSKKTAACVVHQGKKCWIFSGLARFSAFLTGILGESAVRSIEIEPHIVLL
jgi:hypothetical protein